MDLRGWVLCLLIQASASSTHLFCPTNCSYRMEVGTGQRTQLPCVASPAAKRGRE